jgi:hypothetical protein
MHRRLNHEAARSGRKNENNEIGEISRKSRQGESDFEEPQG